MFFFVGARGAPWQTLGRAAWPTRPDIGIWCVCVCVPDVRSDIVPLACRAREFRFEVRGRTFVTSHMRLPKSSDRAGA